MGKYFAVAVLESGVRGTVFFDDEPSIGSMVTVWAYNEAGLPGAIEGKLARLVY